MSHRLTLAAALALPLLAGAAGAEPMPPSVGISVEGTVVAVPVDLAARACGISAETLQAQWAQLDRQMATMAATSVAADATDLAPVAAPEGSQKAAGVGPSDQAPASASADAAAGAAPAAAGTAAPASEGAGRLPAAGAGGDLAPVVAAASPQASAAANPQDALGAQAAPTENTPLSKAAVCEITAQKAADLGIPTPD